MTPGFFFQAEDGIRDFHVTRVQTCALPICTPRGPRRRRHPHRRMATPHRLLGPAHARPPRLLHVVGDPRRPCRDDQGRPPPPHGGGARAAPAPPGTNPHRGVPKTVTESNQTPGGVVNLRECRRRFLSVTALFSHHHQL